MQGHAGAGPCLILDLSSYWSACDLLCELSNVLAVKGV